MKNRKGDRPNLNRLLTKKFSSGPMSNNKQQTFLQSYSNAMEEKLKSLKDKIEEKKKSKGEDTRKEIVKKQTLENFAKKQSWTSKKTQSSALSYSLVAFLTKIGLMQYQQVLLQNQIKTLEVLAEASQKELEEAGLSKGHALKVVVNLKKQNQSSSKQKIQKIDCEQQRVNTTGDSERLSDSSQLKRASDDFPEKKSIQKSQSICIGTESEGVEHIELISKPKTIFCLFCYASVARHLAIDGLCSEECSQKYSGMFKKYENNLVQAESQFRKEKDHEVKSFREQKSQSESSEQGDYYDFLEQNDSCQLDLHELQNLKDKLK